MPSCQSIHTIPTELSEIDTILARAKESTMSSFPQLLIRALITYLEKHPDQLVDLLEQAVVALIDYLERYNTPSPQ